MLLHRNAAARFATYVPQGPVLSFLRVKVVINAANQRNAVEIFNGDF
jgi:hypothetical protein